MATPGLTDAQIKEAFETLKIYKTKVASAQHLGISSGAFHNRIRVGTRRGYSPDHDMNHIAPEGFALIGTSTLYGPEGEMKNQWVKTTRDAQQQQEAIDAAIMSFKDELPRATPIKAPITDNKDIITVYPVSDHHFGMLAWHEETGGDDYDTKIAEDLLCAAMDYLVKGAPKSEQCAILILGDFLHYDGMSPVTPASGHLLDSDSRYAQVVRAAMRSIRFMVSKALQKHDTVNLTLEIGNHDPSSTIMLMEMFYMHFENEPRVIVDRSPRNIHMLEFGKNLICTHHGDKIKMDKLPLVIADDFSEAWGRTKNRVVHTGHIHHDHIKEHPGMSTESHGILAPKDAYAANGGWRAKQSMKAIYYHRAGREVGRNIANAEMFLNG